MVDFDELQFGTKLYHVHRKYNVLRSSENRLKMVDDQGNTWYRYKTPQQEFFYKQVTYEGLSCPQISGKVIYEDIDERKYFLEDSEGVLYYVEDCDREDFFETEQEACDYAAEKNKGSK